MQNVILEIQSGIYNITGLSQIIKIVTIKRLYWSGSKWSEKVTNEELLGRIGEKRALLNNIQRRKTNSIGHILRTNCRLH